MHVSSRCSKSLSTFVSIFFNHFGGYVLGYHYAFNLHFPGDWGWKPLYFVHLHIFFFKVLFQAFLHFSVEFSVFFPWIWFVGIVYKFWVTVLCIYICIYTERESIQKKWWSGKIESKLSHVHRHRNLNQSKILANHM